MTSPTGTGIRIRPLRSADIESIVAIDAAITGEAKAGFWRGLLTLYEPHVPSEEELEGPARPASPTYLCEVAEVDGAVAGFIVGDVQAWQFGIPRCGRIIAIGVRPEHRRGRIASMLAQELLEAFRKMNLPVVQCLVKPGDSLGTFFTSLGFAPSPWITLEKRID